MLIQGDNLLALKALEQEFAGRIKCIYIDPPYNTGNAFEHYDDGLEHSQWLNLISPRLKLLRQLLAEDGSIWISIDDDECHYLKVLCDEVFGRGNFVANVIWEKTDSPRMDAVYFSVRHDHILVYAKNKEKWSVNKSGYGEDDLPDHYDKTDENGRQYYLKPLRAMGGADSRTERPTLYFPITAPDGTDIYPKRQDGSDGRWRWGMEKIQKEKDRIHWLKSKSGWTINYRIYADSATLRPPETIWTHAEAGSNRTSKIEIKAIFSGSKVFDTPKPERLIERVLTLATKPGDWVLDSFLGSGTTAAVAHKMGRRWVGVELGEHARTHCVPRLQKVVSGEDGGGISKAVGWQGGGGFKFYTLAPSLLNQDAYGNWVISKEYNPTQLAAAVAKHEGFRYAPDPGTYWKQARSSEKDYLYVTTQFVTVEALDRLHDALAPGESLLIACRAYQSECAGRYASISLKKIPTMLLGRCEFGREDYSLNIVNVPTEEDQPAEPVLPLPVEGPPPAKPKPVPGNQLNFL